MVGCMLTLSPSNLSKEAPLLLHIPPTWAKPGATARLETAFSTEAGVLGEGI
ncbi:hypothetical protein MGG_17886 [Pyricularia oryzae 70-15]|uniref:Uncharacterized protein n=3 Tax=Pyricularia oryzae TaxID=318829 RepID=G5EH90_PYRO7|nr:uncharacterized protein MGG_17886 [Pyricularia oryzae 70-15]EAQ71405.1 hypothetical protein MGCH7_ch7g812 [Pyricularia oryzae 70-15]EHA45919.1 hypothetical protein MGG_17886 [Pyricularia oryzae 70-15]ELQ41507.1 hypothetical protein OOU_Y34scaffold00275g23 [Pyricularia oryzae Y34]